MGEARRTILVHIWDDDEGQNGLGFGMSGFGVDKDEIKCAKDKAGMGKDDPHKITFEINNRTTRDLRFPDKNPHDAMWVGPNSTTCPQTAPTKDHAEFPWAHYKVLENGEQLEVKNLNSSVGRYKFSLNFAEDGKQTPLIPYDPIWNNQNGGGYNK